jgi:hypothetical protein
VRLAGGSHRLERLAGGRSAELWPLGAVVAAVLLANALYLLGIVDPNPLGPDATLVAGTTHGFVNGLNTIDPNTGFVSQAEGHRAALALVHLHMPWWNPFEGTGAPLAGEMQSAALFPPTLLTLLANGQLWEHVLLELLTGLSTYLLLRRLSILRVASLAAAIAFALNGTFAWFAHAPVNPIAWLPMLLLGIELVYEAAVSGTRGGWWLMALAGALSIYAGFPETAYVDTLLAFLWFLWRWRCAGSRSGWRFVRKSVTGALAGGLLGTPLLLASLTYLQHGDLGGHSGAIGSLALPRQGLSMLLLPYVFGPIFDYSDPHGTVFGIWGGVGGYLDASLLLFGLFGLVSQRFRALKLILLAWIVLAVTRMYESPAVLGHVLGVLPGMSRVAFYRYAFPSVELAMVVLAAFGLGDLIEARLPRRWLAAGVAAALGLVGLAAHAALGVAHELGPGHRTYSFGSVGWAVGLILVGAIAGLIGNRRWRAALAAAVLAVDAAALFAAPELSAPRSVTIDLSPVTYLQRHLGLQRFYTFGPIEPNYGSYFGLSELAVNDLPVPSDFAHYVNRRLDPYADPLVFIGYEGDGRPTTAPTDQDDIVRHLESVRAAGVAYLVTPPGQRLPRRGGAISLVFRSSTAWIYHVSDSAPYFSSSASCRLRVESRQAVRSSCATATRVVRRETYLPGWSASVDGRPARVRRVDGVFQAITVPAGTHRIAFSYAPPGVLWGYIAFLLGAVVAAGGVSRWTRGTLPQQWATKLTRAPV